MYIIRSRRLFVRDCIAGISREEFDGQPAVQRERHVFLSLAFRQSHCLLVFSNRSTLNHSEMDSQQHIGTGGIGHEVKNTHVLRHFDHDRPRILEANKLGFAIIGKIDGANNCPFQMADL